MILLRFWNEKENRKNIIDEKTHKTYFWEKIYIGEVGILPLGAWKTCEACRARKSAVWTLEHRVRKSAAKTFESVERMDGFVF